MRLCKDPEALLLLSASRSSLLRRRVLFRHFRTLLCHSRVPLSSFPPLLWSFPRKRESNGRLDSGAPLRFGRNDAWWRVSSSFLLRLLSFPPPLWSFPRKRESNGRMDSGAPLRFGRNDRWQQVSSSFLHKQESTPWGETAAMLSRQLGRS